MTRRVTGFVRVAALLSVCATGCREPLATDVTAVVDSPAFAARRPTPPPAELGSFVDPFDAYLTSRWLKADGWTNGSPFDNAWRADHITFANSRMTIRLDDQTALGEPYTSGNYQSTGFYGYGCYEASFRPVPRSGVVTSFFTFAGPYDNGGNGRHNEIDIEFLGNQFAAGNTSVQLNFFTNDDTYSQRNEHLHALGFDASAAFHRYGFRWTSTGIQWVVDGQLVYAVSDSPTQPTPKTAESLQKVMMNLWPVDATAAGWAGTFVYPGQPLDAVYQWVRFTKGETCTFDDPPQETEPPPPGGDPNAMHVASIALEVVSRNSQVIARVTVLDGAGRPVSGASVTGSWTGAITGGDTRRDTGPDGVATFYSARSKNTGQVSFCVSGVTRTGSSYDTGANAETCDVVVK
jgi:endo-1,3-1,4-beta-glycanase ExoK